LKLNDNLEGGYFTKIKSVIKLTYTKSEDPYLEINSIIDCGPYHTEEEEPDVKEYIKRKFIKLKFGVTEEMGTPDTLMKSHVRIHKLISDINNARIREPFQYTRTTVWVSPSGDSHLLDDVFHDDEACVKALFNEGVFNKNCIPGKTDSAEALVAKFDKLDMFDEIYFHVKKDQARLNASAYPQLRRRVYGVIHSENLSVDGTSVANLYHYPITSNIVKSMCVPMPSYMTGHSGNINACTILYQLS
jgi:hypothetical protein